MSHRVPLSVSLALAAALVALSGCQAPPPAGNSSAPSSSSASSAPSSAQADSTEASAIPAESPAFEPRRSVFTLYLYQPDKSLYQKVEAPSMPSSLLDVMQQVAAALALPESPIVSIQQQKGMVVVDLSQEFLEVYDPSQWEVLFHSIATTLSQNHRFYEWIRFQVAGDWQPFGYDSWPTAPFLLVEPDADAYRAMRELALYPGRQVLFTPLPEGVLAINTDQTAVEVAALLSSIQLDTVTFSSPSELPPSDLIAASIYNTQPYSNPNQDSRDPNRLTCDAMEPIFAAVSQKIGFEDTIWLQEHVELTAKRLFGDDLLLEHQAILHYTYFPDEGVYVPPHIGGGYSTLTAVLDYEDLGDEVHATISYAHEGMAGLQALPSFESIEADQLEHHLREEATRYRVVLGRRPDGSLFVQSQQLAADQPAAVADPSA